MKKSFEWLRKDCIQMGTHDDDEQMNRNGNGCGICVLSRMFSVCMTFCPPHPLLLVTEYILWIPYVLISHLHRLSMETCGGSTEG